MLFRQVGTGNGSVLETPADITRYSSGGFWMTAWLLRTSVFDITTNKYIYSDYNPAGLAGSRLYGWGYTQLAFSYYDTGGVARGVTAIPLNTANDSVWHHYIFAVDSSGNWRISRDVSAFQSGAQPAGPTTVGTPLNLGLLNVGAGTVGNGLKVADFRWYDRASLPTTSEATELFEARGRWTDSIPGCKIRVGGHGVTGDTADVTPPTDSCGNTWAEVLGGPGDHYEYAPGPIPIQRRGQ